MHTKKTNTINLTTRRNRKALDITYRDVVNFNGYPLKIQNKPEWGSYVPILKTINGQLVSLLSHHSKAFALRFDFHVNSNKWHEGVFRKLMKQSTQKIKRIYNLKRIAYVWAREMSNSGNPHFHLMIAVDGNKVNTSKRIEDTLRKEWTSLEQGGIHRSSCHMLKHTVGEAFENAFEHFSYLAKIHTKDLQPKNARNYGASMLKENKRQFGAPRKLSK